MSAIYIICYQLRDASTKLNQTIQSAVMTASTSTINLVKRIANIILPIVKDDVAETSNILTTLTYAYSATIEYQIHALTDQLELCSILLGELGVFIPIRLVASNSHINLTDHDLAILNKTAVRQIVIAIALCWSLRTIKRFQSSANPAEPSAACGPHSTASPQSIRIADQSFYKACLPHLVRYSNKCHNKVGNRSIGGEA